jgi:large conductance mechanosensitive channel
MGFIQEFKEFALKGNVVDLAVGLIIGSEFGKIVNSLVNDVIMPPIGKLIGGVNFVDLKYPLGQTPVLKDGVQVMKDGQPVMNEAFIYYGKSIQTVINFVIIAFCVFLIVKVMNEAKKRMEKKAEDNPQAAEVPADIKLLTEIRDLLLKKPV